MGQCVLRIAIQGPFRHLFDYWLPVGMEEQHCVPGVRVHVPFGTKDRIGILVEISHHSPIEQTKLKPAHAVLDESPLFPESLLKLIHWASQYYQCPLGEVFETSLPVWLRKGKDILNTKPNQKVSPPPNPPSHPPLPPPILNTAQQAAVDSIVGAFHSFKPYLLEGITGSGKTEVYMQLIEACLQKKLQALLLVPEIGLTPQIVARFEARFPVSIAVLHSSISDKKRYLAWQRARQGEALIVIGTRSAAFTPLKYPGIFIIDEEHDPSFKQQEGFRYSARDLLIMRSHIERCPIVLGTATPSLETVYNAQMGRYKRLSLPTRAGNAESPTIQILDVRHKKLDEGLSAQLIQHMQTHLAQNGQVLLFLNRRGFSPVLICFECNFIANCLHCDARLTVHYYAQKLKCHHCEATIPLYKRCPKCQSQHLHPLGVGTERLEAILKMHFPEYTTIRLDRDTTLGKGNMQKSIERMIKHEAHILLGTQMIAKGHHFPNVTLVGILDIDGALFSTDFRSLERLGQLITQVAGRAGRAEKLGHVLLQTHHPDHPLLNQLLQEGYLPFANRLLLERRAIGLPPFSHQALFRSESKKSAAALHFLKTLKTKLEGLSHDRTQDLKILGPVTAPMERRIGQHRFQLLLQSKSRTTVQQLVRTLIADLETTFISRSIRWSIDIDPIDMY